MTGWRHPTVSEGQEKQEEEPLRGQEYEIAIQGLKLSLRHLLYFPASITHLCHVGNTYCLVVLPLELCQRIQRIRRRIVVRVIAPAGVVGRQQVRCSGGRQECDVLPDDACAQGGAGGDGRP